MGKFSGMILLSVFFLLSGAVAAADPKGSAAPTQSATAQSGPSNEGQAPDAGQAVAPGQGTNASGQQAPMTDIHDIKPLVPVSGPVSLATVLLWATVCILAAGLALGAWFLWKRRRGKPVQTIEAMLSPEDMAFQQLATLSADTVEGKAFYFQLSAIFRQYLQGRFGIDGLEMTTEELLPHVECMPLEKSLKRDVKNFLVSCDPVKFAGAPTLRERMANDLGFVRGFVEKMSASLTATEGAEEPAPQGALE